MSSHALLSASSAHRWSVCPLSVTGTDEDSTGRAAAEGTLAHGLSEDVLMGKPFPALGSVHQCEGFSFTVDENFIKDMGAYVSYVRGRPWAQGGYSVENQVNYSKALMVPHTYAWGTSDCLGMQYDEFGWLLEVIDLKFGRNFVSPDHNEQGILYAAGAIAIYDEVMPLPLTMRVRISIFQPRLRHVATSWDTTVGEIKKLAALMRPAADAAVRMARGEGNPEIVFQFPEVAGDHCRYCRRQKTCTAFRKNVTVLGTQQVVHFDSTTYKMRHAIRDYLARMEDDALKEAMKGTPPLGTKLVQGKRANPQLIVPLEQVYQLANSLGIANVVRRQEWVDGSPAAIRDALKGKGVPTAQIQTMIRSEEGKPILVDETDPRPAYSASAGSGFTGVAR